MAWELRNIIFLIWHNKTLNLYHKMELLAIKYLMNRNNKIFLLKKIMSNKLKFIRMKFISRLNRNLSNPKGIGKCKVYKNLPSSRLILIINLKFRSLKIKMMNKFRYFFLQTIIYIRILGMKRLMNLRILWMTFKVNFFQFY